MADIAVQLDDLKKSDVIIKNCDNVGGIEKLLETTSSKLDGNNVKKDQEMKTHT